MAKGKSDLIDISRTKAILIGTGQSQDDALSSLYGVESDIKQLQDCFANPDILGLPGDSLHVALNAPKAAIDSIVRNVRDQLTEPHSNIILYFSGHGIVDIKGNLYLAALDTDHRRYIESAIDLRNLLDVLSSSKYLENLIIILDCAHSGSAIEIFQGDIPFRQFPNFYVLTASSKDEPSVENENGGVFTLALINALKSGIPISMPYLGLRDIHSHILTETDTSRYPQSPKYYSSTNKDIFIAKNAQWQDNIQRTATPQPILKTDKSKGQNYQLENKLISDTYSLSEADILGYDLHAYNLFNILKDKNTTPPVNIGILAPWGRGKTTLMRKIEDFFVKERKRLTVKSEVIPAETLTISDLRKWLKGQYDLVINKIPYATVWFNPWNYQSSDMIWAGMANAIVEQVVAQMPNQVSQQTFWFRLRLARINKEELRKELQIRAALYVLQFVVWGITGAVSLILFFLNKTYAVSFFGLGAILGAISSVASQIKPNKKDVLEIFDKFTKAPQYLNKLGTFHEVQEDLKKVFDLLISDTQPLIIFVDDLDRCSPSKIIEVVEAINVFISGDHCNKIYFVLGMDAEIISAYLDVAYEKMKGKVINRETEQGSLGWYFLDKFIQLPFFVPVISEEKKVDYLKSLFTPPVSETSETDKKKSDADEIAKTVLSTDSIEESKNILAGLDDEQRKEVDKAILKEQISTNSNNEAINREIAKYATYLNSDPRTLKRFANLIRFYNSYQVLRMKKGENYVTLSNLGKYVAIMLKFPQLIRWLQWDSENKSGISRSALVKAKLIDDATEELGHLDEDYRLKLWSTEDFQIEEVENTPPNLKLIFELQKDLLWLKSNALLNLLLSNNEDTVAIQEALICNIW